MKQKITGAERRGNMVYTDESKPGKAVLLLHCHSQERAQEVTDAINTVCDVLGFELTIDSNE